MLHRSDTGDRVFMIFNVPHKYQYCKNALKFNLRFAMIFQVLRGGWPITLSSGWYTQVWAFCHARDRYMYGRNCEASQQYFIGIEVIRFILCYCSLKNEKLQWRFSFREHQNLFVVRLWLVDLWKFERVVWMHVQPRHHNISAYG